MPSTEYKNNPNYESPIKTAMRPDFRYPSQADTLGRRALENANYLSGVKQFRQSPEEKEKYNKQFRKEIEQEKKYHQQMKRLRQLNKLQKNSPKFTSGLAIKRKKRIKALVSNLLRQIDWSVDWLFILLGSFGLLKDIFDIAFAALGALPVVGIAGVAIGVIVSFVGNLMFLILTVTVLVLVGSSLKNRGPAKYFVGTAMEFIAEALPAISWLPWTPVYVLVLYLFVLYDRAYQGQGEQTAQVDIPASGAADKYYEDQRQAA